MRNELLADLNRPLREALDGVLTAEQKKEPMLEKTSPHWLAWSRREWGAAMAGS